MSEPRLSDWYLGRILLNTRLILEYWNDRSGRFEDATGPSPNYNHCLRALAWLYLNETPGNPHFGDRCVLEIIRTAGDNMIADCRAENDPGTTGLLGPEWLALNMLECVEMLGDRLGPERLAAWRAALVEHLDWMSRINNYIVAAPNHIVWRMALLHKGGEVLGRPDYCRVARMVARQGCRMQTHDGYWDESRRGHGPSPNYHRTHIHGLDLYQRWSGDEEVLPTLLKGIEFAVRSAYPDGTPIEAFDGRQPYLAAFAVGMAANALSRTADGRRLLRLQQRRLDELELTCGDKPTGFAVLWYLFASTDFMFDCFRYAADGDERPLPQESDGHTDTFRFSGDGRVGGGLVRRCGDWLLAVSAAESDIPKLTNHVYNCERQNGISLWHAGAGLIVGGGNRTRNHVPLCNAHVITGWCGVDCVGGRYADELVPNGGMPILSNGRDTSASDPVKSCYLPIQRQCESTGDGARLTLRFTHATVELILRTLDDSRVAVDYAWESAGVTKVLLQVPVPVFWPGAFTLDGVAKKLGDMENVVSDPLASMMTMPARAGRRVSYRLAGDAPTRVTWPLEPIKNWKIKSMNYVPDLRYAPLYFVAVISREFHGDAGSGRLLTVEVG
ncbi:MAG: hypothetical protein BIFFINMI_02185 [Phycisphaerae bacterium]|nr:hypothetical protein [Phycisphaerae bacterium]